MKKLIRLFKFLLPHQSERLFQWRGLSPLGEIKSGLIAARSRVEAQKKLRSQTIILKKLSAYRSLTRDLQLRDIALMLQQLSRIMNTGISLIQALQILTTCQIHPKLIILVAKLQTDLESGASFSEALSCHPQWFDPMICALINLGEKTGQLCLIVERIAQYKNNNHLTKQKIKTLLTYPTIVIIMAAIVTIYLLITVVPQLQTFFNQAHQPLPASTRLMLTLSIGVKDHGIFGVFLGAVTIFYLKTAYRRWFKLRHWVDKGLIHLPIMGKLCHSIYLARAFHALAIAQQASLPLPDALQLIADISGNVCYQQAFLQIRTALQQGESLRSAVVQTKLFPKLVEQLLNLGEESGTLSLLVMDLADYYTQTLEDHLQRLSRSIEPLLMIILGLIIGGLILALYLPIIQLGAIL